MNTQRTCVALGLAGAILAAPAPNAAHGVGPLGAETLDWHTRDIARVVAPVSTFGNLGSSLFSGRPARIADVGGRACLHGGLILFDVNDVLAFDIDETVELEIQFQPVSVPSVVTVAYDKNGEAGGEVRVNLPAAGVGGELHTERVRLPRARFAGRGDWDTDLMIAGQSGVTICDLRVERSFTTSLPDAYGWLELTVRNEQRQPTPARLGLYDETGRTPLPSAAAVELEEFDEVTVDLERWMDLPSAGWYSGDVHIHRAQRDAQDSQSILLHAQAEDIHVANALEMGNAGATHYPQRAWGAAARVSGGAYTVAPGQEDPRTAARGHTIHLDLPEPVRDPSRYLLYHEVFARASELGAVSGYAHVFSSGGATRSDVGLALDAPFDLVDFVEVLQSGLLGTDLWFGLLNLGYQIAPAAGSDYPYFLGQIGSVRSYVRIDGDYSADRWFEGLATGRTFVTNGPILSLDANGADIGSHLALGAGERLTISADAAINPDIDLLERIQLVEQGEVVAEAVSTDGTESLALEYATTADHGTWFVVRANGRTRSPHPLYGDQTVHAISAPVYVSVDGERTWKRDAVEALAGTQVALLDEFAGTTFSLASGAEYWEDGDTVLADWPGQMELLATRIDEAKARYEALIRAAR